jgi:hypothetical protein
LVENQLYFLSLSFSFLFSRSPKAYLVAGDEESDQLHHDVFFRKSKPGLGIGLLEHDVQKIAMRTRIPGTVQDVQLAFLNDIGHVILLQLAVVTELCVEAKRAKVRPSALREKKEK